LSDIAIAHCAGISTSELEYRPQDPRDRVDPLHGLVVENSIREVGDIGEGLRVVCIREQLQDLKENAKLLIEDELQEFGDLRPLGS
jgi:hypothetical protein